MFFIIIIVGEGEDEAQRKGIVPPPLNISSFFQSNDGGRWEKTKKIKI